MSDRDGYNNDIFSKVLKAGRRTYFFDVRETKAGDYYLTITESKRVTEDNGNSYYKKHKIYLYKEDFDGFKEELNSVIDFVVDKKGTTVISEKHQDSFGKESDYKDQKGTDSYTDIQFEDI